MSDEAIRALNVVSRNLRESAKDFERHGGFDYPVSAYERMQHGADEIDRLEAGNAELRESVSYEQRVNSDLRAEKSRLESDLAAMTADRDAWRRRAEAAEKDLLYLMNCDEMDGCDVCKKFKGLGVCKDCEPEWRGPDAQEGV